MHLRVHVGELTSSGFRKKAMKVEMDILKKDFQLGKCIMYGESLGIHHTANCCTRQIASFPGSLLKKMEEERAWQRLWEKLFNFQHVIM